jgi:hypothetical protein
MKDVSMWSGLVFFDHGVLVHFDLQRLLGQISVALFHLGAGFQNSGDFDAHFWSLLLSPEKAECWSISGGMAK